MYTLINEFIIKHYVDLLTTDSSMSTASVLARLYSILHLYEPSSSFRMSFILKNAGIADELKNALPSTYDDKKCVAAGSGISLASTLYNGLPASSLCQSTKDTSSSVEVTFRSHGSCAVSPSKNVYVGRPKKRYI